MSRRQWQKPQSNNNNTRALRLILLRSTILTIVDTLKWWVECNSEDKCKDRKWGDSKREWSNEMENWLANMQKDKNKNGSIIKLFSVYLWLNCGLWGGGFVSVIFFVLFPNTICIQYFGWCDIAFAQVWWVGGCLEEAMNDVVKQLYIYIYTNIMMIVLEVK